MTAGTACGSLEVEVASYFPLAADKVHASVKIVHLLTPHAQPLSHWERVAEGRVGGQSTMEMLPSAV